MMEEFFLSILTLSISTSYIIGFVIVIRLLLRKTSKIFSYALWAIVFLKLICPISLEGIISLIPKQVSFRSIENTVIDSSLNMSRINSLVTTSGANDSSIVVQTNKGLPILSYLSVLWVIGIILITIYSILSYTSMKKRLSTSIRIKDNLYESDRIQIPFVMGLIKPHIYIPVGIGDGEKDYIIQHEQIHIQRRDYIIKLAAYFISCFHWFNPLVWIAFRLMNKDMEMSCDEKIIKKLGSGIKKEYANSLLSLASGRKIFVGVFTAFGENNVKSRIKNVLSYKKPTVWILVIASLSVVVVGIGLFVNPSSNNKTVNNDKTVVNEKIIGSENDVKSDNIVNSDEAVKRNNTVKSGVALDSANTVKSVDTKESDNTVKNSDIIDGDNIKNSNNAGDNTVDKNNIADSVNKDNKDKTINSDKDNKSTNTHKNSIEDDADEAISEYLDTPNGILLKKTADSFVKAYFSGDADKIDQYLAADADYSGNKVYQIDGAVKNVYGKLIHLLAKWYTVSDEKADVQYEHQIKGEDSYTYMGIQLEKSDGKWLVTGFYFEK